ncbi:MAG: VWA domain-containing protein [Calditrichaeota bacterium]|jgi:Ca-activated chloride channel homolog|nr:VWA domain-containing protein [Calditrichota bacterium]
MNDDIIRITDDDLKDTAHMDLMSPTTPDGGMLSNWNPSEQSVPGKQSVDIVLCVDTSGSMEAADYLPSRLAAAKDAALMFTKRKVTQNYNDRVAVIGFGGNATVVHPLEKNLDSVGASISKLNVTHSGTSLGHALSAAYKELSRFNSPRRAIVLLSDGGDEYDNSKPEKIASSHKGIKVFTIGLGTTKGAHVKFLGKSVSLNETILKQIANVSGGEYLHAPGVPELQRIYLNLADY